MNVRSAYEEDHCEHSGELPYLYRTVLHSAIRHVQVTLHKKWGIPGLRMWLWTLLSQYYLFSSVAIRINDSGLWDYRLELVLS